MKNQEIALELAERAGYDGVEYLGTYKDRDVFNPTYDGDDTAFVGAPLVIFVENGKARMSTADEAFEYLDYTLRDEYRKMSAEELKNQQTETLL